MKIKDWTDQAGSLFKREVLRQPVKVGWFLQTDKAGFIWEAPRRFQRSTMKPAEAVKSAQYCPAVLDYEALFFEVPCPIDARLRFRIEDGKPQLINVDGEKSPIRGQTLAQMVHVMRPSEWRYPDRPIIQISTPYSFVTDEPVHINQMPAFFHYFDPPLPGVLIGGRFPLHTWPRILMWAFEWHDTSRDLVLRRGEPWFYVRFELPDPARRVKLVEAELTPELQEYLKGMTAVTNFVKRTFSLFSTAQARRPRKLLVEKQR